MNTVLDYIQAVKGERDRRIQYNQGYWDGYQAALTDIEAYIKENTYEETEREGSQEDS